VASKTRERLERTFGRGWVLALVAIGIFLFSALLCLSLGTITIPIGNVFKYLFGGQGPGREVFWQLHLPRVILALLVGASLSMAGAILQGLFLNPLTDPYVTGVSSGAALGAAIAIFTQQNQTPSIRLTLFALAGGLLTITFVYLYSKRQGKLDIYQMLLGGVTLSFVCFAVMSILLLRTPGQGVHSVLNWLLGSFANRGWQGVTVATALIPFLIIPFFFARELNVMLQGEERALELGVNVERVKTTMLIVAAILTAVAVSVSGVIGFVGLIVPHICRLLLGPNHKKVFFLAVFLGGSIMALSDLIARSAFSPAEIPVGVITIFFGAPFFLYLLRRKGTIWTS